MTLEQHPGSNQTIVSPLRTRWWKILLALSLAANLMIVGLAIGHRFGDGRGEHMKGGGYAQLVPRRFFAGLPRERRRELFEVFKQDMEGLRGLRGQADATSLRIADALEKQPYDPAVVQQAVVEFATGSQSLAAKGSAIVTNLVAKLTPEERAQLAAALRESDHDRKQSD